MEAPSFKKILITSDLSQDATTAYAYAAYLSRAFNSQLLLLSCIDTSIQFSSTGIGYLELPLMYNDASLEEIKNQVRTTLQEHVAEHFPGLQVRHEVREAPYEVQQSILNYIQEDGIDLVVMSSHGRSGIKRALLGSVAEYVVRHSQTPVLVVPVKQKD